MALTDTDLLSALLVMATMGGMMLYFWYRTKERVPGSFRVDFSRPYMTVLLPVVIELLLLEFATGVDTGVLAVSPVLWILVGVILQPVVEEIVFRGWLLGYFLKVADGCTQRGRQALTIGGLVVSSVVFMFYHLRGFEVMLLAGGLVFGLLFLGFRRNIVPAVVAHMAANLLVLLAAHGLLPVGYLLGLFV